MNRPEAFKLRGNTGNTGYGFEQLLDDNNNQVLYQPNGAGIPGKINNGEYNPEYDGPNTYQFAAPGNLGSLVQPSNNYVGKLLYKMQAQ